MSVAADIDRSVTPDIVRCIEQEEIPIIDVGAYLAGEMEAREQFAVDLRAIQESLGFFVIVNHGVSQDLIDRSFEQVAELFALPLETKMKYQVDYHHIGYIPDKASVLRHSEISKANKNKKKDKNEGWSFMRDRSPDDPKVVANVRHRGLNKWPEELPNFRAIIREYQDTMEALALKMLPVYARALGMPANYFDDKFTCPEYYNRCSWYPPTEVEEGQLSVGAHSDHSSMTYLPLMGVPGLEVMAPSGKWIQIDPLRGGIVVNTGEFMNRWSNGRFIATPHRVVPPVRDRYALTFFFNSNDETLADPLPTCVEPGAAPKYEPISFHDFQVGYLDTNYIYRTAEMDQD
jgi:isopenicillin N synthase-like dioxygenase